MNAPTHATKKRGTRKGPRVCTVLKYMQIIYAGYVILEAPHSLVYVLPGLCKFSSVGMTMAVVKGHKMYGLR